eukprot:g19969.t1
MVVMRTTKPRPVIALDSPGHFRSFPSIRKAARSLGIDHSNILRSMRTGMKAGGYNWCYQDDDKVWGE